MVSPKVLYRRKIMLLGLTIGILLAFSMLTTSFIAADYFAVVSIMRSLKSSHIDLEYYVKFFDDTDLNNVINNVSEIEYVKYVSIGRRNSMFYYSQGNISDKWVEYWYIVDIIGLSGENGLVIEEGAYPKGGVVVHSSLAEYLGVSVGDNITILWTNKTINLTVEGIYSVEGFALEVLTSLSDYYVTYELGDITVRELRIGGGYVIGCILVSSKTYDYLLETFYEDYGDEYELEIERDYFVFVELDKDKLIIPWDLEETSRRVETVKDQIISEISTFAYSVYMHRDNIGGKIRFLQIYSTALRISVLYMMAPLLIMAVILVAMVNWVSADVIARDIALLRIRGATKSSIATVFGFSGAISGVVGGLIGALVSPIFLNVIVAHRFAAERSYLDPFAFALNLIPNYMLFSSVAGLLMGFFVSFWVGNRASNIDISRYATGDYLEQREEFKFGRLDKILFILGVYSVFELTSGLIVFRTIFQFDVFYFFLLAIALIFFFIIEFIAISIGPFLFLYTASKIIAGKIIAVSRALVHLVKPFLRDLSHIPAKGLARNFARLARVFFILSLALAISILTPIMSATQMNRERIESEIFFGADIKVEFYSVPNTSHTLQVVDNLTKIEGIEYVSPYARFYHWGFSETAPEELIVVNHTYLLFDQWRDEYLVGGTKEELAELLSKPNTTILSYGLAKQYDIKINDTVNLYYIIVKGMEEITVKIELRVIGFVKFLVGYETYSIFVAQEEYYRFGIISFTTFEYLKEFVGEPELKYVMIDVYEGANITKIKEEVSGVLDEQTKSMYTIRSFEEYLDSRKFYNPMYIIIYLSEAQLFVIAIISMMAISLLMFVSIWERKRELALLYVRGLSKTEILFTLIVEAFLISLIGLAIGLIVAVSYSSAQANAFGNFMASYEYPAGYLLTIPWYLPFYIISLIIIFSLSAIPSYLYLIRKKEILEEVRVAH